MGECDLQFYCKFCKEQILITCGPNGHVLKVLPQNGPTGHGLEDILTSTASCQQKSGPTLSSPPYRDVENVELFHCSKEGQVDETSYDINELDGLPSRGIEESISNVQHGKSTMKRENGATRDEAAPDNQLQIEYEVIVGIDEEELFVSSTDVNFSQGEKKNYKQLMRDVEVEEERSEITRLHTSKPSRAFNDETEQVPPDSGQLSETDDNDGLALPQPSISSVSSSYSQVPECRVVLETSSVGNHPSGKCEDKVQKEREVFQVQYEEDPKLISTECQDSNKSGESDKKEEENHLKTECKVCGKSFSSISSLKRHMYSHISQKYQCEKCGRAFRFPYLLALHSKIHRKPKQSYSCHECGETFYTKKKLFHHIRTSKHKVSNDDKYFCEKCGKAFYFKNSLQKHLKYHESKPNYDPFAKKPKKDKKAPLHKVSLASVRIVNGVKKIEWPCRLCEKSFVSRKRLKSHIVKSHDAETGRPFCCSFCNKRFINFLGLKLHEREHTVNFPNACKVCNKRFYSMANLKLHMQIAHEGKKPFMCEICGRSYTSLFNLRRHKMVHSGNKPFACNVCGKTFCQKTILQDHIESMHQEGVKYECEQCGKQYRNASQLRRHLKVAEVKGRHDISIYTGKKITHIKTRKDKGGKQFPCKVCGKIYYSKVGRYIHDRKVHVDQFQEKLPCRICSKMFYKEKDREQHELLHYNGKLKHKCQVCNKWFRAKNALRTHMKTSVHLNKMAQAAKNSKQWEIVDNHKDFGLPHPIVEPSPPSFSVDHLQREIVAEYSSSPHQTHEPSPPSFPISQVQKELVNEELSPQYCEVNELSSHSLPTVNNQVQREIERQKGMVDKDPGHQYTQMEALPQSFSVSQAQRELASENVVSLGYCQVTELAPQPFPVNHVQGEIVDHINDTNPQHCQMRDPSPQSYPFSREQSEIVDDELSSPYRQMIEQSTQSFRVNHVQTEMVNESIRLQYCQIINASSPQVFPISQVQTEVIGGELNPPSFQNGRVEIGIEAQREFFDENISLRYCQMTEPSPSSFPVNQMQREIVDNDKLSPQHCLLTEGSPLSFPINQLQREIVDEELSPQYRQMTEPPLSSFQNSHEIELPREIIDENENISLQYCQQMREPSPSSFPFNQAQTQREIVNEELSPQYCRITETSPTPFSMSQIHMQREIIDEDVNGTNAQYFQVTPVVEEELSPEVGLQYCEMIEPSPQSFLVSQAQREFPNVESSPPNRRMNELSVVSGRTFQIRRKKSKMVDGDVGHQYSQITEPFPQPFPVSQLQTEVVDKELSPSYRLMNELSPQSFSGNQVHNELETQRKIADEALSLSLQHCEVNDQSLQQSFPGNQFQRAIFDSFDKDLSPQYCQMAEPSPQSFPVVISEVGLPYL